MNEWTKFVFLIKLMLIEILCCRLQIIGYSDRHCIEQSATRRAGGGCSSRLGHSQRFGHRADVTA